VLKNDYFKNIIDLIYSIIPDRLAKDMVNRFIGVLSRYNTKKCKGSLTTSEEISDVWTTENKNNCAKTISENRLYLLYEIKETNFVDTNMPIGQAVRDMSHYYLYKLENKIRDTYDDVNIISYHTDSITFSYSIKNKPLIKDIVGEYVIKNKRNKYKLGSIRDDVLDIPSFDKKENKEKENKEKEKYNKEEPIFTDNNWNYKTVDDINDLIIKKQGFSIIGKAGRGKTYTLANSVINKIKGGYVAISLSHKAVLNLKDHGINNSMVAAALFNLQKNMTIKQHLLNISKKYEYLIVDEYTMVSEQYINYIYSLYKHGTKIIVCGDDRQIPYITTKNESRIRYTDRSFFREMCSNNLIRLEKNYRFDEKLDEICDNVYERGIFKLNKHKSNKDKLFMSNLCFTHKTKDRINKKMSSLYINKNKDKKKLIVNNVNYALGMPILCVKNKPSKGWYNNRIYTIKDIKNDVLTLDDDIKINKYDLGESFKLGFAYTVHSSQGSTISNCVCIYETEKMSRELLYTALTRLTSYDNLYIDNYKHLKDIRRECFTNRREPIMLDDDKRLYKKYVYGIYENDTLIDTILKDEIDANLNLIKQIRYDTHNDLYDQLARTSKQLCIDVNQIKAGKINTPCSERELRGSIIKKKNLIRVRWHVNGVAKEKNWLYGKKRSLEEALELAYEYQREINV